MQTFVRGTPVRSIVDSEQTFVGRCESDRTPVRAGGARRGGQDGGSAEHDRAPRSSSADRSDRSDSTRGRRRFVGRRDRRSPTDRPRPAHRSTSTPRHARRGVRSRRAVVRHRGVDGRTECCRAAGAQRLAGKGVRRARRRLVGVDRQRHRSCEGRSRARPSARERAPRRITSTRDGAAHPLNGRLAPQNGRGSSSTVRWVPRTNRPPIRPVKR